MIKRQLVECYSRVVGYIRPVRQWNLGKQSEFKDRITFKQVINEKHKLGKDVQNK